MYSLQEAEAAEAECRGELEEMDAELAGLDAQLAAQQQGTQSPYPDPEPDPALHARKAGRKVGRRGGDRQAAAAEDEEGPLDLDTEAAEPPPQRHSRLTKRTRR